jgi:hypothetical protein
MSGVCYPDSLIGTIPNLYYYAANNPRRAARSARVCSSASPLHWRCVPCKAAGRERSTRAAPRQRPNSAPRPLPCLTLCPPTPKTPRPPQRGDHRQAPVVRQHDQLPHAAGRERGAVQGPEGAQGADRQLPGHARQRARRADHGHHHRDGAPLQPRQGRAAARRRGRRLADRRRARHGHRPGARAPLFAGQGRRARRGLGGSAPPGSTPCRALAQPWPQPCTRP